MLSMYNIEGDGGYAYEFIPSNGKNNNFIAKHILIDKEAKDGDGNSSEDIMFCWGIQDSRSDGDLTFTRAGEKSNFQAKHSMETLWTTIRGTSKTPK